MEEKLAAYRAEKQRRWEAEQRRQRLSGLYQTATGLFRRQTPVPSAAESPPAMGQSPSPEDSASSSPRPAPSELRAPAGDSSGTLDWLILACKVGLYLTLFGICCHFQFGAAYVVVTAIPIIYFR